MEIATEYTEYTESELANGFVRCVTWPTNLTVEVVFKQSIAIVERANHVKFKFTVKC